MLLSLKCVNSLFDRPKSIKPIRPKDKRAYPTPHNPHSKTSSIGLKCGVVSLVFFFFVSHQAQATHQSDHTLILAVASCPY